MTDPNSCINKAADDEPVFVLRAQDALAPSLVRTWAGLAELHDAKPAKVAEARALASAMEEWPTRRFPT